MCDIGAMAGIKYMDLEILRMGSNHNHSLVFHQAMCRREIVHETTNSSRFEM